MIDMGTQRTGTQPAGFDPNQRRAGVRRTAWIVGATAFMILLLFLIKQGFWR